MNPQELNERREELEKIIFDIFDYDLYNRNTQININPSSQTGIKFSIQFNLKPHLDQLNIKKTG